MTIQRGKVIDISTGKPISDVHIMVTNPYGSSNIGTTVTDSNGDFSIEMEGKSSLKISHSSYAVAMAKTGWLHSFVNISLYPIGYTQNQIKGYVPPHIPWINNHIGYVVIGGVVLAALILFKE